MRTKTELKVDKLRRTVWVRTRQGKWLERAGLDPKEFDLLCYFLERPGIPLERRILLEDIWPGKSGNVNLETVDRHVESLRKKLGARGDKIRTVHGVGYALEI